jgi:formylglycine-generating enzyme required for sulfatase activity
LRVLQIIAVVGLALACALAPARAEKRVALVVGNGAYRHADKLANPVNDARGMRDALAGLKFDVVYGEDLDGQALRRLIGQFAGRVDGADVALVYFAGHGATFGDAPYVVPVDATFSSLDEAPFELVAVETLIGELRRAKNVRIAILDACRDNAAEQALKRSRGGPPSRGLAPPKNPSGLIIAYATQHGATAADSAGAGNSPFTAALLQNIATPGLDVKDMFFKVGSEVDAATRGRQQPEISVSMFGQYALVPSAAGPGGAGPGGGSAQVAEAAQAWEAVKNTPSLDVMDAFLRQYGHVPVYGELARTRRAELAKLALVVTPPPPPSGDGPLTAAQERGLKPKDTFRECRDCPEMVVVPAGSFTMGSPSGKKERNSDEGPQHVVTIGKPFAVGKLHVTRDQFAAFVTETGYAASTTCFKWPSAKGDGSWRDPGFAQDGSHPVVCVSWDDAMAYVDWMAKKTGKPYRLLSEAEFEYAARGRTSPGSYPRFWFGNDEKDLCRYGNGADQKARDSIDAAKSWTIAPCNDGYAYTSPAGHYEPNAFGLYDMAGNAWQWMADCYHDSYTGAPADGSVWTTGTCSSGRVVRGGSWYYLPGDLRAAQRVRYSVGIFNVGFRVARTLTP